MKKISEMTPGEALTEQALAVFKRRLEQARKKAVESAAATKAVFDADQPSPRIERVENVKDLTSYISRIDEMIERKRIFFDNNML